MKQKDELFLLIQSMSKAEKRYFKLQAGRQIKGDTNNYARLFDLLGSMKHYNKQKIEKAFKGEAVLNNFSTAKRYLFNAITDSLLQFHANDSLDVQLQKQINRAKLLLGRGLFKEVNKIVKKVKQLAGKYQLYHHMHSALTIERTLISAQKATGRTLKDILKIYDDIIRIDKRIMDRDVLGKQNQRLLLIMKQQELFPKEKQLQLLNEIEQLPEVQDNLQSDCFKSQVMALEITNKIAYFNNDMESSYQYYRQLYQLYKAKSWLSPSPIKMVMMTHNFLYRCAFTERYEEMKIILEEIRDFGADNLYDSSTYFECYYSPLLIYCRKTADFSVAPDLQNEIEVGMGKFTKELKLIFKLNMMTQVAAVLFIQQNYNDALDWINRFLDHPQRQSFKKILPSALVFRLLIYLELGAYRLLEYQVRNTARSLQNIGLYPQFSKAFTSFAKTILDAPGKRSRQQAYQQLYEDLATIYPIENPAFGMFDFLDWANSKQQQISMQAFVRRKLSMQKV